MERRCALQQRARSSFEKVHAGEAPPHLQVIGFNVCSPPKISAETEARRLELARGDSHTEAPPPVPPKPASSPRSALQQLLLTQPLHSSSPLSPTQMLPRAASPSLPPCPPATPSPSINQNATSEIPPVKYSPASTHQNDPSCGILKSLVRFGKANEDDRANQSFISTDHCKFLGQSQVHVSTPSPRNRSAEGVRLNVHVTYEYSTPKSSRASMKENYAASINDETGYTDKKICAERPDPKAKGNNSGWLQDDDEEPSSAESFTDGGQKGGPQVSQSSLRNEKSKKSSTSWIEESTSKKSSSLFMFVVSSPVPEVGRHLRHGKYDACEDTDFLSSCHLCRRHLGHGKDVFMYRGDKAFCSMECRYQQIVADERRERCPPPVIRSGASQVYGQHAYSSTTSPATATHVHAVAIDQPHFINTAMAA